MYCHQRPPCKGKIYGTQEEHCTANWKVSQINKIAPHHLVCGEVYLRNNTYLTLGRYHMAPPESSRSGGPSSLHLDYFLVLWRRWSTQVTAASGSSGGKGCGGSGASSGMKGGIGGGSGSGKGGSGRRPRWRRWREHGWFCSLPQIPWTQHIGAGGSKLTCSNESFLNPPGDLAYVKSRASYLPACFTFFYARPRGTTVYSQPLQTVYMVSFAPLATRTSPRRSAAQLHPGKRPAGSLSPSTTRALPAGADGGGAGGAKLAAAARAV